MDPANVLGMSVLGMNVAGMNGWVMRVMLAASLVATWGVPASAREPPLIAQRNPAGASKDYDGSVNCGPTCVAMIARAFALRPDKSDAALIEALAKVGRIKHTGVTRESFVLMANALDLATQIRASSGRRWVGSNIEWLARNLDAGNYVVLNTPDHYVLAISHEGKNVRIHDPAGRSYELSMSKLARLVARHRDGGGMIAIGRHYLGAKQHDRAGRPRRTLRRR